MNTQPLQLAGLHLGWEGCPTKLILLKGPVHDEGYQLGEAALREGARITKQIIA
jgi:hypothetical protein